MLIIGIGSKILGSFVKSILNLNGQVQVVLESNIILSQSEVEDYVKNQNIQ